MPGKRGVERHGQIPETVSLPVLPPETEDRLMPSH